jgi:cobalt/nickel transport system permease protein
MTSPVDTVTLPLEMLLLPAGGLALLWALSFWLLRRSPRNGNDEEAEAEKNWGIPAIDSRAHINSPFHSWDPRVRIVSLIIFIFCAASVSSISVSCIALLLAVLASGLARIPFARSLRRLRAMIFFLGMFLLVMPLTVPAKAGDTLYAFNYLSWLHFNGRGFLLAVIISLKALAIALMTEPLLATSKLSVTVQALASLKIPQTACQMILLAHRYIFVFQNESVRMRTGMRARGFRGRTDVETLRTIGNFLGMLLVRSFGRTQKVYDAMLARGYTGKLQRDVEFKTRHTDWAKGAFWVLVGIALLIVDRIWQVPVG